MKKALIIVWEFPPGPGGIGQHAYCVAHSLYKKGFDVHVITSADYGTKDEIHAFDHAHSELEIQRPAGSRLVTYVKRISYSIRAVTSLRQAEIIFSGKGALWLLPWLKLLASSRNRFSAFVHGSEIHLPGKLSRTYTLTCLRFTDRIFYVSEFTKNLLPEKLRNKPNGAVLVNGLIADELPAEPPETWAEISLVGSPRLLTVGQLTRRKGQHRVIKALPHLQKRWPTIHFHMVGLDTDRERLMELASSLGVSERITVHGRVGSRTALFKAYASAEVFVMLSENQPDGDVEGFGIAILEANYVGLPAIGARGCGIEEAIQEGVNGYLVNGDDVEDIERALEKCLTEREGMQNRMQQWVEQHQWDSLIEKFLV